MNEEEQSIQRDIESGKLVLEENQGARYKSDVWKRFLCVKQRLENKSHPIGFVQCNGCELVLKYDTKKGTNILRNHKCCEQQPQGAAVKASNLEKQTPPPGVKKDFRDTCIMFCARDLRPFETVAGEGFKRVIQKAIDIGVDYGRVSAEKLLSSPKTLSANLNEKAGEKKLEFMPELTKAVHEGKCAATTDMWSERYTGTHFSTVTVHYITDTDWKLITRVLFTAKFPDSSATAENIEEELLVQFSSFGIGADDFAKIVFVTDGGTNIVKALENFQRNYCLAHKSNRVLVQTFQGKSFDIFGDWTDSVILEEIKRMQNFCSKNKNKKLQRTFKVPSKGCSGDTQKKLFILKAMVQQYDEVSKALKLAGLDDIRVSKGYLREVNNLLTSVNAIVRKAGSLNREKCQQILKLAAYSHNDSEKMKTFKDSFKQEFAALNGVIIIDTCKSLVTWFKKSDRMKKLSKHLKQAIDVRWNSAHLLLKSVLDVYDEVVKCLEEAGAWERFSSLNKKDLEELVDFLAPFKEETDRLQADKTPTLPLALLSICRLKKHCTRNENDSAMLVSLRKRALLEIEQKVPFTMTQKLATFLWPSFRSLQMLSIAERNEVYEEARRRCEVSESGVSVSEVGPPANKRQKIAGYEDWAEEVDSVLDEVSEYLKERIGDDSDLLIWWREREHRFPRLAKMAKSVLAIPATSASSERNFSDAGTAYAPKRNALSPNTLDDLLFLHSALKDELQPSSSV